MKKLVLLLAVVFSASLFSCGGEKKTDAAADSVAADSVEAVDTTAADTTAADTAAADTAASLAFRVTIA